MSSPTLSGGESIKTTTAMQEQDAVGDGRLRPRCRHLANWMKRTRRL